MVKISEACIGCGECVRDCVAENLVLDGDHVSVKKDCLDCGHCVAVCPSNAVSIPAYDMDDVEEIDPARHRPDPGVLLHALKSRRSIRHYRDRPVEADVIGQVLQAGRYSATGKNAQDCRFIFVQDRLDEFKGIVWPIVEETAASGQPVPGEPILLPGYRQFVGMRSRPEPVDYLFRDAPAVLYIASDAPASAPLAAQSMELMAVAQGLGVMYNGYLVRTANAFPQVAQWLDAGEKRFHICMLIGYPDVNYVRTAPRKPADIVWR